MSPPYDACDLLQKYTDNAGRIQRNSISAELFFRRIAEPIPGCYPNAVDPKWVR